MENNNVVVKQIDNLFEKRVTAEECKALGIDSEQHVKLMLTRVRELYPNITLEYVIHNKEHRVFLTENSEEDASTNSSLFEALTKYRRYFCDIFPGESIHYPHGESLRELYKVISGNTAYSSNQFNSVVGGRGRRRNKTTDNKHTIE